MVRLEAASEAIRTTFPNGLVDVYAGVTALGNPGVLTVLLALVYWGYRREGTATVVGYAFLAFALVLFLKELFAMPRPPESVMLVGEDGYGFPSGHAIAGVVVYGGLALEFDWFEEPPKAFGAGLLALSVGLSRIVLGVHYLGDVLVGAALGLVVLVAGHSLWRDRPAVGYGLGAVVAAPAVLVSDGDPQTVALLGSCLGGVWACRTVTPLPSDPDRAELAFLLAVGVLLALGLVVARGVLETNGPAQFVLGVVTVATILALPASLDRLGAFAVVRRLTGRAT
ncbi:phosphatase PAP2 family protein [Haloarchaeobius iranensis]|uniref:PAP2 superfamily protein n=1 Tax=Haloarchaeobius iranensis TaxID=996166 RepID=A0A1G9Z6L2_9EURY|nr:phosphatase PAP2 family protein [Haloarchaeobius iranensis]SDN16900.1 PAP2 superfamily protein [Haloarchaeobius iranensis]